MKAEASDQRVSLDGAASLGEEGSDGALGGAAEEPEEGELEEGEVPDSDRMGAWGSFKEEGSYEAAELGPIGYAFACLCLCIPVLSHSCAFSHLCLHQPMF